ncbi:MAG: DUF4833 domain-containing protein [Bacteroidota bacterium]
MVNFISFISVIFLSLKTIIPDISDNTNNENSIKERLLSNILFVVRHNKSPNYVVYKANIATDKKLNNKKPVDVFWFMKTKGETTEELTIIEWKLAFGFKLDVIKKSEEYKIKLNAIKEKRIIVKKNSKGVFICSMLINGKMAKLRDVFINYETTFSFPTVKYLDFRGIDIITGKFITERYFPD